METLDKVQRRIDTTTDIGSVVRTMKALAAVNIRQYERAVESLGHYHHTIEKGFQIVLQQAPGTVASVTPAPRYHTGAVVFGSDQGMCGPLNDRVVQHALNALDAAGIDRKDGSIIAVGSRVAGRLSEAHQHVDEEHRLPGSIPAITSAVQRILLQVDRWQSRRQVDQILLFYARHDSRSSYRTVTVPLLPIDREWLQEIRERAWPTRSLPTFTLDVDRLFSALIRQHLFIGIYRAFAETLASENASRLMAMRRAEKNIDDRLAELKMQYHQQRQAAVTEELLDIVGAFESLEQETG